MRYSAASESDRQLDVLLEFAQKEPVFIDRDRQEVGVLISSEEYERLRAAANLDLQQFCHGVSEKAAASGLTEAKLNELLSNA